MTSNNSFYEWIRMSRVVLIHFSTIFPLYATDTFPYMIYRLFLFLQELHIPPPSHLNHFELITI
jgi:hypothetical protein